MPPFTMPRFGLGTWRMGENRRERPSELAALRTGLALGVRLIDTAEMYGGGNAEKIVGEAIADVPDHVTLVTKCYPHHAGAKTMPAACQRSLERLGVDRIDCYLLHWRGRVPLAETVETFERLVQQGSIARWGVSNFDVDDMEELFSVPGGERCAVDQVLYNAGDRAVEWRLLEMCRARGVALMAYSPLGQGGLLRDRRFRTLAGSIGVTPAQLALAFLLAREGVVAIPKTSNEGHLRDNLAALSITLDEATLARLDAGFPPPDKPAPIAIV